MIILIETVNNIYTLMHYICQYIKETKQIIMGNLRKHYLQHPKDSKKILKSNGPFLELCKTFNLKL